MPSNPLSLVKRLKIFVSHPHVEWHETSTALDADTFREIDSNRRLHKVKAKRTRERQRELEELRHSLLGPLSKLSAAEEMADGSAAPAVRNSKQSAEQENQQAFMSTLDAAPAIAQPMHVHTAAMDMADAFANTSAESVLRHVLARRQTRIGGEATQGIVVAGEALSNPAAANDNKRTLLPDSIQAAAIALAVGDKAAARAQLKAAFVQAPNKRMFAQAWLECLRACNEPEAYATNAAALAELLDFVVPPFFSSASTNVLSEPQGAGRANTAAPIAVERFTASAELGIDAADDFYAFVQRMHSKRATASDTLTSDAASAVLSFVALKTVATAAAQRFAEALALLNDCSAPFVLQGGTVLLDNLLELFTAQQSLPVRGHWFATLEACRLLGKADKYEALIHTYSNIYIKYSGNEDSVLELSCDEYVWVPTKAKFTTFHRAVDDSADLAFSIESSNSFANGNSVNNGSNDEASLPVYTAYAQPVSAARSLQCLRLAGQGTYDRVTRVLELADTATHSYNTIELDLSRLVLIHFDAAVALLNWAQQKREHGISVVLQGHGLLTQALFEQISIADFTELHPHYF